MLQILSRQAAGPTAPFRRRAAALVAVAALAASVAMAAPAWAGSGFVIEPAPAPDLPRGGSYQSVDCPTADECWATVVAAPGGTSQPSQLAHWVDGSWSLVDSAAPAVDVDCRTASNCWAVGDRIQHWDGTSWTVVDAVNGHVVVPAGGQLKVPTPRG